MSTKRLNAKATVAAFMRRLVVRYPDVTFDQLQDYFRSTAKNLCDEGLLIQHADERLLNGFPLEYAVKRIFIEILSMDSRKAWNRYNEPEQPNLHEFIVERGFLDDDTDAERRDDSFHFRLVFEVKSHAKGGATIADLRQLEDWVGRKNREFQKSLTNDGLKRRIKLFRPLLPDTPRSEHLRSMLNPYKGVFVLNHEWDRESPSEPFPYNECAFAEERDFCLMSYRDLLKFRDSIRRNDMDAWFFLEEIALTAGVYSFVDYRALSESLARQGSEDGEA